MPEPVFSHLVIAIFKYLCNRDFLALGVEVARERMKVESFLFRQLKIPTIQLLVSAAVGRGAWARTRVAGTDMAVITARIVEANLILKTGMQKLGK